MIGAIFGGNNEKAVHAAITGTSLTTVLTGETAGNQTLASFGFANSTASAVDCSLYWRESGGSTDRLIWFKSVAAKTTEVEERLPLKIGDGDLIKVIANTGVSVTLITLLQLSTGAGR